MAKGRRTFTAAEINRLRQLFIKKDKAESKDKKCIRDEMRDMKFYISDFRPSLDSNSFEQLLESGEIQISDGKENVKSCVEAIYQKGDDFKEGLAPWIDEQSEILILGSLPSDTSIQKQAYYQNKSQNSFWKLMHSLFGEGPDTKEFLMKNHIALWDCLADANRRGSVDKHIADESPNEIPELLASHPNIKKLVLNGLTIKKNYFDKYFANLCKQIEVVAVNSSSNNNSISFEKKLQEWKNVLK